MDGQAITYDGAGNPLSYYDGYRYTFTWTEGRRQESVTYQGRETQYEYDHNGIRTKKLSPDGSYTVYDLVNGKAVGETRFSASGTATLYIRYIFDEAGSVIGISLWYPTDTAWTDYFFVKNLQGDVIQVFRASDNTLAASYTYDAWGNILSQSGDLANINPFRYRSYYYDNETWFYYLQSRYYDPAIGRFINADGRFDDAAGFTGFNLYAYCANNPIIFRDDTGEGIVLTCIIVGVIIGVAAGSLGGSIVAENKNLSPSDGWDYWKYVVYGGIGGGALGGLAGWAFAGTSAAASISWAYYKATTAIGTSAYAIGSAFEKWFYKAYNVVQQQVRYHGYRFDAIFKNSIVELKNYNWSCYSNYDSIIKSFTTQARNYMQFVGEKINGELIKGVTFCFSSKPPEEVIRALRELGVTVNWLQ